MKLLHLLYLLVGKLVSNASQSVSQLVGRSVSWLVIIYVISTHFTVQSKQVSFRDASKASNRACVWKKKKKLIFFFSIFFFGTVLLMMEKNNVIELWKVTNCFTRDLIVEKCLAGYFFIINFNFFHIFFCIKLAMGSEYAIMLSV